MTIASTVQLWGAGKIRPIVKRRISTEGGIREMGQTEDALKESTSSIGEVHIQLYSAQDAKPWAPKRGMSAKMRFIKTNGAIQ